MEDAEDGGVQREDKEIKSRSDERLHIKRGANKANASPQRCSRIGGMNGFIKMEAMSNEYQWIAMQR